MIHILMHFCYDLLNLHSTVNIHVHAGIRVRLCFCAVIFVTFRTKMKCKENPFVGAFSYAYAVRQCITTSLDRVIKPHRTWAFTNQKWAKSVKPVPKWRFSAETVAKCLEMAKKWHFCMYVWQLAKKRYVLHEKSFRFEQFENRKKNSIFFFKIWKKKTFFSLIKI